MGQHTPTSERIDDLPLWIYWLKQMQVDVIIDRVRGSPHGNWEGLGYGDLTVGFIPYLLLRCRHFLSPVEAWATEPLSSLSQALGKPVRGHDFPADRLAVWLSRRGDETSGTGEALEVALGQQLLRAYALPTDTARIDLTRVTVHHQPESEQGLMRFGHSKDPRSDLRQFKALLATLAPAGGCRWPPLSCQASKPMTRTTCLLGSAW